MLPALGGDMFKSAAQRVNIKIRGAIVEANQPPSVGAKDLKDYKNLARAPVVVYLQKQAIPDAPRLKPLTPAQAATAPPVPPPSASPLEAVKSAVHQKLHQFESGDWFRWFYEYIRYRLGPRHAFLTYEGKQPATGIYALKTDERDVRIGLAGDWGTGTDEAYKVAKLIDAFTPHYTVHLGDVYFVGDRNEVKENFLGVQKPHSRYTPCTWPKGSKGAFALNGNHEMYALGKAYFDDILPALGEIIDDVPQQQKASYFCLQNDEWCILGLDTGYNSVQWPLVEYIVTPDCSLRPEILSWLQVIAGSIGDRAVIILTHHQVLSVYDSCFTTQADQIFGILKRPVLWFWGHEHRMVVYDLYVSADRKWPAIIGRCIGHGGMPVDLPGPMKSGLIGSVEFVDERLYKNDENLHVGMNGFARLTFSEKSLKVEYVDVNGDVIFEEAFRAEGGCASRTGFVNHALTKPAAPTTGRKRPERDPCIIL